MNELGTPRLQAVPQSAIQSPIISKGSVTKAWLDGDDSDLIWFKLEPVTGKMVGAQIRVICAIERRSETARRARIGSGNSMSGGSTHLDAERRYVSEYSAGSIEIVPILPPSSLKADAVLVLPDDFAVLYRVF